MTLDFQDETVGRRALDACDPTLLGYRTQRIPVGLGWVAPSPLVLRKIFELKTLGPDLGCKVSRVKLCSPACAGLCRAGLIIPAVSRGGGTMWISFGQRLPAQFNGSPHQVCDLTSFRFCFMGYSMPSATALWPSRTFCCSLALRVEGWMLIVIFLMVPAYPHGGS